MLNDFKQEILKNPIMVNENQLLETIKEAKKSEKERKFKQSLEMIMVFRDIDVKKGFAINEVIQLPKEMSEPAKVCVMASGDMGLKAKDAKADEVLATAAKAILPFTPIIEISDNLSSSDSINTSA